MSLVIRNNLMADNAARHLSRSYDALSKSVERLSSGLRINSSRDDAAGLAVRELIRADVAMFRQASRNAADGISMLQTGEGAMAAIDEILIRMKELAEQASTDSYSGDQRTIMDNEYGELSDEITRIAQATKFNEKELLNSTTTIDIHLGEGKLTIAPQVMDATTLGVNTTQSIKEIWTHLKTVASAGDEYIAAADITDTTEDMIKFDFAEVNIVGPVSADIGAYATTGISLNELVQEINTAAGYAAAFATYNSEYASYSLQLKAEVAGDTTFTITDDATTNTKLDSVSNFGGSPSTNGADGSGNDLLSASNAQSALASVATAIGTKDSYRAKLGYWMNRLSAAVTVLDIQVENLSAAESRISDVDVATEMAAMTRNQVLAQAGIAMLGQANVMPQMALQLLR